MVKCKGTCGVKNHRAGSQAARECGQTSKGAEASAASFADLAQDLSSALAADNVQIVKKTYGTRAGTWWEESDTPMKWEELVSESGDPGSLALQKQVSDPNGFTVEQLDELADSISMGDFMHVAQEECGQTFEQSLDSTDRLCLALLSRDDLSTAALSALTRHCDDPDDESAHARIAAKIAGHRNASSSILNEVMFRHHATPVREAVLLHENATAELALKAMGVTERAELDPPYSKSMLHGALQFVEDKDIRRAVVSGTFDGEILTTVIEAAENDEERTKLTDNGLHYLRFYEEVVDDHDIAPPDFNSPEMVAFLGSEHHREDGVMGEVARDVIEGEDCYDLAAGLARSANAARFGAVVETHLDKSSENERKSLSGSFENWGLPLIKNGKDIPMSTFDKIVALAPESSSRLDQQLAYAWTERTRPDDQLALTFPE